MAVIEIDPNTYSSQLEEKLNLITTQFAEYHPPQIEVFESAPLHYRARAEFRVWHDGDDLFHIMFDPDSKQKIRVDRFPAAIKPIYNLMPILIEKLKGNELLRRKLFQIDYLSGLSGQILVSLIYHKPLDDAWQAEAEKLKAELNKDFDIDFIGRARKQKRLLGQEYIIEKLSINDRQLTYKQVENSFTQPNARVNEKMLEWATSIASELDNDLLELYCGNGNFSIAMAPFFNRVLATEISKSSVASAQFNIEANQVENLKIIRMSSEEFTQAMRGEQTFKRLDGIDLNSYQCQTILVDPPRAGLDSDTRNMVQEYTNIIYISCNPETLHRDLQQLNQSHEVKRMAIFDQFPYTHHIETGVWLSKKQP